MRVIKPPRLRKGDLISVVSPASSPKDSSKVHAAVAYFESLGYRVTISKNVFDVEGYLAGSDGDRAEDLNQAFADKNVKAVVCSRGGYGTPRILDLIDYSLIARNPKIFVGYSDITALQLAIFRRTGLLTFSGPMMAVEFGNKIEPYTEESFFDSVTRTKGRRIIRGPKNFRFSFRGKKKIVGRLLGGNLSLMTAIFGTRYIPDFSRSILLVEEVNEEPYSIDRMFTQLRLAGVLKTLSGFMFGQFTDCNPEEPDSPHRTLEQIMREDLFSLDKPSVSNIPYGHLPVKLTLPIGGLVGIDPARRRLTFEEPLVI